VRAIGARNYLHEKDLWRQDGLVLLLLVVLLLAGLPVAVWLDLTNLADTNLKRQI
jgi:hypothetical protein